MGVPSYGAAPGMIPPYGGAIYPPPQAPVVGYGPPPIYPPAPVINATLFMLDTLPHLRFNICILFPHLSIINQYFCQKFLHRLSLYL